MKKENLGKRYGIGFSYIAMALIVFVLFWGLSLTGSRCVKCTVYECRWKFNFHLSFVDVRNGNCHWLVKRQ
ncbi:hypothetical protein CKN81_02675 [Carnobacterium divergens]|nr:hypothetical protein CKN81_02675 [Carnobacterium divergens]